MKPLLRCCATSILFVGTFASAEQALPYGGAYDEIYKYDHVADAPIESDIFERPLTFGTPLGVITIYGQGWTIHSPSLPGRRTPRMASPLFGSAIPAATSPT